MPMMYSAPDALSNQFTGNIVENDNMEGVDAYDQDIQDANTEGKWGFGSEAPITQNDSMKDEVESVETSSDEGQNRPIPSLPKRSTTIRGLGVFNPNNAFIFNSHHTKNLGVKQSPNVLSKLPADRKRKGLEVLMENMNIEPAQSPKFIPTESFHPDAPENKRIKGATLPYPFLPPAPGSLYPPSTRQRSSENPVKRNPIVYAYKSCGHSVEMTTMLINTMGANVGSNLIITSNPRYFIIREPRWCADCIKSKTKLLRLKYPDEISPTDTHFNVIMHAKEKGWIDGQVAALSIPLSVCNDEFPRVKTALYMPPKPVELGVEELVQRMSVEDNEEEKERRQRERKEVEDVYDGAFRLDMKYKVCDGGPPQEDSIMGRYGLLGIGKAVAVGLAEDEREDKENGEEVEEEIDAGEEMEEVEVEES
jgi:hypothetical protein